MSTYSFDHERLWKEKKMVELEVLEANVTVGLLSLMVVLF